MATGFRHPAGLPVSLDTSLPKTEPRGSEMRPSAEPATAAVLHLQASSSRLVPSSVPPTGLERGHGRVPCGKVKPSAFVSDDTGGGMRRLSSLGRDGHRPLLGGGAGSIVLMPTYGWPPPQCTSRALRARVAAT